MIENDMLQLDADYGGNWKMNLYLPEAFPNNTAWMKKFNRLIVKQAKTDPFEDPIWEQIVSWLEANWMVANDKRIIVEQFEVEGLKSYLPGLNKEDKKDVKRNINYIQAHIRKMQKNEQKVKNNIEFIKANFIEKR